MITPTGKVIDQKQFVGLEVTTSELNRTPNSWRVLKGWDLFVPGSLRKTEGLTPLIGPFNSRIVASGNYRRTPTDPLLEYVLHLNGELRDVTTGAVLTNFPAFTLTDPYVCSMTGLANGETISYLVAVLGDAGTWKWDGANAPTPVGLPGVEPRQVYLYPLATTSPASNLASINILVGRNYRLTFWNPITQQESAPTAVGTTPFNTTIGPTEQIVEVTLPNLLDLMSLDSFNALIARGFTRVRLYATRDGGDVFYLLDQNSSINFYTFPGVTTVDGVVQPPFTRIRPDDFGSLPWAEDSPAYVYMDGFVGVSGLRPTVDAVLLEPGPTEAEKGPPPPKAVWGAVYQGRLWLVPSDNQSDLAFSSIGDFENYPVDNVFHMQSDDYDPIVTLVKYGQYLVVGRERGAHVISGTDFTDFSDVPLDPRMNVRGRRLAAIAEGGLYFLSRRGLDMYEGGAAPSFVGAQVRALTDQLDISLLNEMIISTYSPRDWVLMSLKLPTELPMLLIVDPTGITTMALTRMPTVINEVKVPATGAIVTRLALWDDVLSESHLLTLFLPTPLTEIVATAETQKLPQDELPLRKTFRRFRMDEAPADLTYACAVDDQPFWPEAPVALVNPIGLTGKQLVIRFRHAKKSAVPVVLSNYVVEYVTIGETR